MGLLNWQQTLNEEKMSSDLCWSIVRKNSCFLVKSLGKTLTREPNNVTGENNYKSNGYINKKTVGVEADPSGKGVVLSLRKSKGQNKPNKAIHKTTLRGSRHSIKAIRNALTQNGYRKDLSDTAIRRASAIIRSQNASSVKKRRSRRKKN